MDDVCKHENFESHVKVARLKESEELDNITGFSADIRIRCRDCKTPFEFVGLPMGSSPNIPMMSADKMELRAPIKPSILPEHGSEN